MVSRPHGGRLVRRVVEQKRLDTLLEEAEELPHIRIDYDSEVDVKNIAVGVYSPLEGFMNGEEYRSVLEDMRLPNDLPWTIPILLDATREELGAAGVGDDIALYGTRNTPLAIMRVDDIYGCDRREYAERVFKTCDPSHPGTARLSQLKERLISGKVELLDNSQNDFDEYTLQPSETRILFQEKGWNTIVGFQTRNAPHSGHEHLQKAALALIDGVFVNPVVGRKKRGDFKDEVIVATYRALIDNYYPRDTVVMSLLHYEMKYAGPREAILHAIMRKNFGCTHFIVGRDHAGVGNFYGPYEAQEIFSEFPDLGVTPLFFREFFNCRRCGGMVNEKICPHAEEDRLRFSGTKLREAFTKGQKPSPEVMRPEVAEVILQFDKPFVE